MIKFKKSFGCTDTGKVEAVNEFNRILEFKEQFYFIRLVYSSHPYSEGYWIETDKKELSPYDHTMLEYDGRAFMRDKQIDDIIND